MARPFEGKLFGNEVGYSVVTKPAKPFSLKTVILAGLALAVCFLLLSWFFFFVQVQNTAHRMVGQVTAVEGQTITIVNARGQTTLLKVSSDVHLKGVDRIADIPLGQKIMVRGDFKGQASFDVDGLRLVKE